MTITKEEENKLKLKWLEELQASSSKNVPLPSQMPEPPTKKLTPYVLSIVIMGTVVILAIVLLSLFSPEGQDNTITIALIIGLGTTITQNLFTSIKVEEATQQSKSTYLMVNSRLTEMMTNAKGISHAEGVEDERNRADAVKP